MRSLWQRLIARIRRRSHVLATPAPHPAPEGRPRPAQTHVILLDGTLSSLAPGDETNIGLTFRLLREARRAGAPLHLYYEAGVQWAGWRHLPHLAQGQGLNAQIRRAYGWLAMRYRPGDRIFLFGYSRGAYAVRSLAGVIDRVGLLRHDMATERMIRLVWRHYQIAPQSPAARHVASQYCHGDLAIDMVGVFDTVAALGMRLPLIWMLTERQHRFHSHQLGRAIRLGCQALALDETRVAFAPVLWQSPDPAQSEQRVQQLWFRGAHGDIGGQLGGRHAARPLSNIPLVWILAEAEAQGLALPADWRARHPQNPEAPMAGSWRGFGALFLLRWPRKVGLDPSERLHPTAWLSPRARRLRPADLRESATR